MEEAIIGISAFYHDSAACIIVNGKPIAAAQEERFTRRKHDASFPTNALRYCLEEALNKNTKITGIAFYEKPYLKFERLLETYHAFAPSGIGSYLKAMPVWIKDKLFVRDTLKKEMRHLGFSSVPLFFPEHHLSHAASAFYPSPFQEAAILTLDGVGEWATTTIGKGEGSSIEVIKQLDFPHSLGLLYSAFTYFCGFRVNSGEYKLMGLAPYGDAQAQQTKRFEELILQELVDLRNDGSFLLNMKYFDFATGLRMTHTERWIKLFGIRNREEMEPISAEYMNLALAIQRVTEKIVVRLAITARNLTGCKNLVIAGGVALNCVSNAKIRAQTIFEDIWIQPAAGDAGGALGAAMAVWHIAHNKERPPSSTDSMNGSYLGNAFSTEEIMTSLRKWGAVIEQSETFECVTEKVARLLQDGNVIGWFQGRMEYGPRALGNRSILADPRNSDMQQKLNIKIKNREGFRPFAPAVREEDVSDYFIDPFPSPYMLFTMPFLNELRYPLPGDFNSYDLYQKCNVKRSGFPAVTHLDYSARVQSVSKQSNPRFWKLLTSFKELTGSGILVNTSFNVRGEPMVCTPEDAYQCFMQTDMDYLVIGDIVLDKKKQPKKDHNIMNRQFDPD